MKVYFGEFYSEAGASFPFSHHFNHRLAAEITALVAPSALFREKFGEHWSLMFRINAKSAIEHNEIRGPAVFKNDKEVEYFISLPFSVIRREANVLQSAIGFLLDGVSTVFASLAIPTGKIEARRASLIESICSDPAMFTPQTEGGERPLAVLAPDHGVVASSGRSSQPACQPHIPAQPPQLIAIDHDDYHASHVGRTADGEQFFLTTPFVPAIGGNAGREFVALYLFDANGTFREARIDDLGTRAELDEQAFRSLFERRLGELGAVEYCRIEIQPFQIQRFGITFGLIPRPPQDEDDGWWVEVQPGNYMAFHEPFDSGEYDT
jgi:hypothetical protein